MGKEILESGGQAVVRGSKQSILFLSLSLLSETENPSALPSPPAGSSLLTS